MARIPTATYRLQFCSAFGFAQAKGLLSYLSDLGITDAYASPLLAAFPGSTHGYDVIDHSRLNPELGNATEFAHFAKELRDRNMGMLLDVVPNHMCVSTHLNRWWNDVLENGRSSPFATYFDIDWEPPSHSLVGKVLLPILADQYGRVLESGELHVAYQSGSFSLHYYDRILPLAPESWLLMLEPVVASLESDHERELSVEVVELASIVTALRYLPSRAETDADKIRERSREKEVIKSRLLALTEQCADVQYAIEQEVARVNGHPGSAASFDRLDTLLSDQAFRVAFWRVAADEINYRRFFDVNELAALRVEEPEVFAAAHEVILRLVHEGPVTGLRIDHVDGLFDPTGYLTTLQDHCRTAAEPDDGLTSGVVDGRQPIFLVVEKILAENEPLPGDWPVQGTTGYDFLNLLGGVFVDRAGASRLLDAYEQVTEAERGFPEVVYACKKLVLRHSMSSQVAMLARRLDRISEQHRHSRDFTQQSLQDALIEVTACLPVYRTYLGPQGGSLSEVDHRWIGRATHAAKRRNAAMNQSLFDFVKAVLTLDYPVDLSPAQREEWRDFVLRFQQFTGAVAAKAVEDTAFYRFCPLASRGEVGGSPDDAGVSVDTWHDRMTQRLAATPGALSTTSTHDTKRGEDVRARIRVVSEMPAQWMELFGKLRKMNAPYRAQLADGEAPDVNEEYLLYQTLLGAWPFEPLDGDGRARFIQRIQHYMQKALREAKVNTSWLSPNEGWEEAVSQFVERILIPTPDNSFLAAFAPLQRTVARVAVYGSLAQVVLKITAPGVPDFYQGSELWDLNLVDPDNRAAVDFTHRRSLLDEIRAYSDDITNGVGQLLGAPGDGRIKMLVTHRALTLRRSQPELFAHGRYVPLSAKGPRAKHIIAFARIHADRTVVVATGRLFSPLSADVTPVGSVAWSDTRILQGGSVPSGTYRDVLTGRLHVIERRSRLQVARVFEHLPVAVMERVG